MSPLTESTRVVLKNYATPTGIAGIAPTLDYRFALDRREIEAVSLADKVSALTSVLSTNVRSDGTLANSELNTIRFQYDPDTLQSLGALVEPEVTNYVMDSNDFNKAVLRNSFFSRYVIDSPLVGYKAHKLRESTSTTTFRELDTTLSVLENLGTGNVVFSMFAKKAERSIVSLLNYFSSPSVGVSYDLESDEFFARPGSTMASSYGVIKHQNGWRRIWYSVNLASNTGLRLDVFTGVDRSFSSYTGDGNSGIYVWGLMGERGTYPSQYLPTPLSSTQTKPQDSVVIDGNGVITGTYTLVEKPAGSAVVNGSNIDIVPGYTCERVMVFPTSIAAEQISAIRSLM